MAPGNSLQMTTIMGAIKSNDLSIYAAKALRLFSVHSFQRLILLPTAAYEWA
jgi:hypothetical protein